MNSPNLYYLSESRIADFQGQIKNWAVYRCNRCAGLVTATGANFDTEISAYYPAGDDPISIDIPSRAREYLTQGFASGESPVGAVLLAASAVDAMLKVKNYTDGSLNDRINKAASDNLITTDMATWAHNVRLDANDQRHSDEEAVLPTSEDAKRSLDFALALGEILYVLPARVTKGITT